MADIPSPPAKTTVRRYAPGQVSWLSDRPTPRAFPAVRASGFLAGFVPDHSDGVAADSHRLPWALTGTWTLRQCTLAELGRPTQPSPPPLSPPLRSPSARRTKPQLGEGLPPRPLGAGSPSTEGPRVRGSGLVRQPL